MGLVVVAEVEGDVAVDEVVLVTRVVVTIELNPLVMLEVDAVSVVSIELSDTDVVVLSDRVVDSVVRSVTDVSAVVVVVAEEPVVDNSEVVVEVAFVVSAPHPLSRSASVKHRQHIRVFISILLSLI